MQQSEKKWESGDRITSGNKLKKIDVELMKQRANPDVREVFGEVRVGLGGRRLGSGRPGAPCLLLPTAAPHIAHTPRVLQPIGGSSARSNWNRKLGSALASFVITDTFQLWATYQLDSFARQTQQICEVGEMGRRYGRCQARPTM